MIIPKLQAPIVLVHGLFGVNHIRLDRDYLVAVVRDVTERKRAEEALRRSEGLLGRAEAMANVAAWTFEAAGGVFVSSEAGSRVCGWAPGPHGQDELFKGVHPADLPPHLARMVNAAHRLSRHLDFPPVAGPVLMRPSWTVPG